MQWDILAIGLVIGLGLGILGGVTLLRHVWFNDRDWLINELDMARVRRDRRRIAAQNDRGPDD